MTATRLTDNEKGKILAFRSQGLGYRKIGRKINCSVIRNFLVDPEIYKKKIQAAVQMFCLIEINVEL